MGKVALPQANNHSPTTAPGLYDRHDQPARYKFIGASPLTRHLMDLQMFKK